MPKYINADKLLKILGNNLDRVVKEPENYLAGFWYKEGKITTIQRLALIIRTQMDENDGEWIMEIGNE